jgi:nitrite reductase/ring-hydroxylating ferredoxin subunit
MSEVFVGKIGDFAENDRMIVRSGNVEIGVLHRDGNFYAYRNRCLHQGGPVCEGLVINKVEDVIAADGTYRGQRFSPDVVHFVCPWHGYEYDLETGVCAADARKKLQQFKVVTKGDSIYVIV